MRLLPQARRSTTRGVRGVGLLLLLLAGLSTRAKAASSTIPCTTTQECVGKLHVGSECLEGRCTNPYHKGGCLGTVVNKKRDGGEATTTDTTATPVRISPLRVCSPDDPLDGPEQGICRRSEWNYPEVRIYAQNWWSALLITWVIQIVLSEMAEVPSTVETGVADLNLNFYHPNFTYGFGDAVDWDRLRHLPPSGDCRSITNPANGGGGNGNETNEYQSCFHVVPEVWNVIARGIPELVSEGHVDPLQGLGALGTESWYVPSYTFFRDPSLVSYRGLQGDQNRRKLAETFLRPTSWGVYCQTLSNTSCAVPDEVAQRAPETPEEEDRYFVKGLYTGHFRKTEENDCDKWPRNCTGHMVDFPCGWNSHVEANVYHLDIPLKGNGGEGRFGGYTGVQLEEIYDAANATKSNVIVLYWTPSVLALRYTNTPAEFVKVSLPPPTLTCANNRGGGINRCYTDDPALIYGEPRGVCDEEPHILATVISSLLYQTSQGPDRPSALHSPAYEMMRRLKISEYQIVEILRGLIRRRTGYPGLDAREGVCEWVHENLEMLQELLPPSFPRTIRKQSGKSNLRFGDVAAVIVSIVALVATLATYHAVLNTQSHEDGFSREFRSFFSAGLLLVSTGALMLSLDTSNFVCVAVEFLTNMGYILEFVPLTIELSASVRNAGLLPETTDKFNLWEKTVFASFVMMVFLIIWTSVDPPRVEASYELLNESMDENAVVMKTFFCSGSGWNIISLVWQLVLLFVTLVRALQVGALKGARLHVLLTYSHVVFATLRAISFFVREWIGEARALGFRTFLLGLDVIATLAIYLIPQFFRQEVPANQFTFDSTIRSFQDGRSSFQSSASSLPNVAQMSSNAAAPTSFADASPPRAVLSRMTTRGSNMSSELFTVHETSQIRDKESSREIDDRKDPSIREVSDISTEIEVEFEDEKGKPKLLFQSHSGWDNSKHTPSDIEDSNTMVDGNIQIFAVDATVERNSPVPTSVQDSAMLPTAPPTTKIPIIPLAPSNLNFPSSPVLDHNLSTESACSEAAKEPQSLDAYGQMEETQQECGAQSLSEPLDKTLQSGGAQLHIVEEKTTLLSSVPASVPSTVRPMEPCLENNEESSDANNDTETAGV